MKKMGAKKRTWLFSAAVLLSSIGAGLVTTAALSPHTEKTLAFAVFCWLVVAAILVASVYYKCLILNKLNYPTGQQKPFYSQFCSYTWQR